MCGGGLLIQYNEFVNNAAIIHASHGGAVSIECDFVSPQVDVSRSALKPKRLSSEFNLRNVSISTFFDSMTEDSYLYDYRRSLRLDKMVIKQNTFDGNEVG